MNQERTNTPVGTRHEEKSIAFLCDQTVEIHFPAHFWAVYLRCLPARGWKTTVLAFTRSGTPAGLDWLRQTDRVTLLRKSAPTLARRILFALALPVRLQAWYRRNDIATYRVLVVHNDPVMALVAYWWARRTGGRFVYRVTHLIAESNEAGGSAARRFVGGAIRRLRDALLRRSHLVLPTSREMGAYLVRNAGVLEARVAPIEAVVQPPSAFSGLEVGGEQIRRRIASVMQERDCEHWLVYLGTLDPQRRPSFLLDTLMEVRNLGVRAGLLVLGVARETSQLTQLQSYAEERGLGSFIVWSDPVAEEMLPGIVALADVGLSPFPVDPILRTNSPLKTLEYMRSGVPVVASPIPDSVDVLECSGAGLVVSHEPRCFARACVELIGESDGDKANRRSKMLEWLEAHRNIHMAAEKLIAAIEGMEERLLRRGAPDRAHHRVGSVNADRDSR